PARSRPAAASRAACPPSGRRRRGCPPPPPPRPAARAAARSPARPAPEAPRTGPGPPAPSWPSSALSFPRARQVGGAQRLDPVGGGPAGRVGAAAGDLGDLRVRQPGQVVVGHGGALLGRQRGQRRPQVAVPVLPPAGAGPPLRPPPPTHRPPP